jgi:hypothetical protein
MNLEQWSNYAEIFGVIALVISLIYVGLQVRQNTNVMQVGAAQAFAELYNTFTNTLSSDAVLAELWLRGMQDLESLDEVEKVRFSALAAQCARVFESALVQHDKGALDEDVWTGFQPAIRDVFSQPGVKTWWEKRKHWHSSGFQILVKRLAGSYDAPPMYDRD